MSLILLHGPAGAAKTDYLIRHILEKNSNNFQLILPQRSLIDDYLKKLCASQSGQNNLWGSKITSFDDFLLHILKNNIPRIHTASESLSRNLIRRLLHENDYPILKKLQDYPGIISELLCTFIQLKKNGLSPQKTKTFLHQFMTEELHELCRLFEDYQSKLRHIHYFDKGDLYLETLQRLCENTLQLPPDLQSLYFDRIFPLTPGQREILLQLQRHHAQLQIMISYSFDYHTQEDKYLYPTYSFLGEISEKNEYFHHTKTDQTHELCCLSDPASELRWIVHRVKELMTHKYSLEKIGILIPPLPYYHENLSQLLEQMDIPFHPSYAPSLGLHLSTEKDSQDSLIRLFRKNKTPIIRSLNSLHAREEFETQWQFEANMILQGVDEIKIQEWKNDELKRVRLSQPPGRNGVQILSLKEAACKDLHVLFIAGYTQSLYPQQIAEHPFYTTEMLIQPEMREILEGPTYQLSLQRNQLEQACSRCQSHVIFSYPKILWDGREQFQSHLLTTFELQQKSPQENKEVQTSYKNFSESQTHFPKGHKNRLSLSELDTYQKCPFKYYAAYHLNLGRKDREEDDIPADIKGSFVHRVLDRLFKQQLELFHEAVEYDLYLNRFIEEAFVLVQKEMMQDSFVKSSSQPIKDSFCQQVQGTLAELIKTEVHLIRSKKKKTIPYYFEWAFGKGDVPPLRISANKKDIFLSGRIDRIDVNEDEMSFTVVDYKTGELDSGTKIKNGESLQLPLYMMAVQSLLLKDYVPAGGLFLGLKDLKKQSGLIIENSGDDEVLGKAYRISEEQWQELKEKTLQKITDIVHNINEGHFEPKPNAASLCRSCDYNEICHYEKDIEK